MTGWDELVAAATVGTGTRTVGLDVLPGVAGEHVAAVSVDEPASALLDAAALLLARRRAGSVPDPGDPGERTPAEPDTGPELTATGCRILDLQLSLRDELLLPALLDAAAAAGRRLPPPLLPALLEVATRTPVLRPVAARIGGRRARWLAGHRSEWAWLTERPADPADPQVWITGGRAARVAHLAAVRAADPAAARDLLATGWARETGDDRAAFVAVLGDGLDLADEPFLEAALDDRAAGVRSAAADLLALLPGSDYAHRCADRAREVLRSRDAEWTPAMGRDGIPRDPPRGILVPDGSWWLSQAIARAPLDAWGTDPAALARTTATEELAPEVHAGWRTAARRERHQQWIAALLATPPRLDDRSAVFRRLVWVSDAELAAALPSEQRAARIARLLRTDPATLRLAELAACQRPWPRVLAEAVMTRLAHAAAHGEPLTPGVRELARHAGAGLPVEFADAVDLLAARAPEFTGWPATVRAVAAVLGVRRTFESELTPTETP